MWCRPSVNALGDAALAAFMAGAAACLPVGMAFAGEARVDFAAREVSWNPGPPVRVVLSGSVMIESGGVRIEAAGAVLDEQAGDLYAEGPVRLVDPARYVELHCDRLTYNLRTHQGEARRARLVLHPPRDEEARGRIERGEVATAAIRAEVVRREGPDRFVAEDVTVTSCDFARPHWRIRARSVEVEPGRHMRARGSTLLMGRAPIFHLPVLWRDLSAGARPMRLDLRAGESRRWGPHVRTEAWFPVRRDPDGICSVDMWGGSVGYRDQRGTEAGAGVEWEGASSAGGASGAFFFENAMSEGEDLERAARNALRRAGKTEGTPACTTASRYLEVERYRLKYGTGVLPTDNTTLLTYAEAPRHYAEFEHRAGLGSGWEFDARVVSASDRDVRLEYFESDAKTGAPDASYVEIRRRTPLSLVSVYSGFRTGPFRTETEYLPEARLALPAADLGGGVVLSAEAATGFVRRSYDDLLVDAGTAEDYEAFRARARFLLARPFRIGAVAFSPYVGTDQALYDRSAVDEDAFARGCALYGGAVSMRLFGRFDRGGRPYRHVVDLRAEYVGVSEPTRDPVEILGFDRADDLMATDRIRFHIDQRLQTKVVGADGVRRPRDVAGLLVSAELFADHEESDLLNSGRDWAPARVAAFCSPSRALMIHGGVEWDVARSCALASAGGIEVRGGPVDARDRKTDPTRAAWRAGLFMVSDGTPGADPSRELGLRVRIDPVGRWSLDAAGRYELEDRAGSPAGWTEQSVGLVRDFHDWTLQLRFWRDPAEDDWGVSLKITPTGYPLNLPPTAEGPG